MNSKRMEIIFDNAHMDFIKNDVLPYLKQVIPSTTRLYYRFERLTGDDVIQSDAIPLNIICNGELCPIYGSTL
jgi:hypothetical protein